MIKLVLVRHGQSVWNLENRFTGWTDVDLSEKGKIEAKSAGLLIKDLGIEFKLGFTSYLKRAQNTMKLIKEQLNYDFPVYEDWRLNERCYGALEGLNKQETAIKYGEEQVRLWRRSAQTRPPQLNPKDERNPRLKPEYKNVKEELPLGESLDDTVIRVVKCYEDLIKQKVKAEENALITAHGNSIRALIKHIDGLTNEQVEKLEIPTGEPIVYEFDQNFNVIKHYFLKDS